jgi:hypothetical protein
VLVGPLEKLKSPLKISHFVFELAMQNKIKKTKLKKNILMSLLTGAKI